MIQEKVRAAALRWKARAGDAARGREELRGRLAATRRELPSVALVEQVFAHRVRTLSARAGVRAFQEREAQLLAGARRVLGCPHIAWQIEIKPTGLRAAGDDPAQLYADVQRAFTHFIDLNRQAAGARVRRVADLPDALRYIEPDRKTDVLLFSAGAGLA